MRTLRFGLAGAIAIGLGFGACFNYGDTTDCSSFCQHANACGLLPSPLGGNIDSVSAMDNCTARCSLTDPDLRSQLTACDPKKVPSDISAWCGGNAGGACEQMADCMENALPNDNVLGIAFMDVQLITGPLQSPLTSDCSLLLREAQCCSDAGTEAGCADAGGDMQRCGNAATPAACPADATAVVSIEQRGQVVGHSMPLSCAAALPDPVSVDAQLGAGPARPFVTIRTATSCWVYGGTPVVLSADTTGTGVVPIPADGGAGASCDAGVP